MASKKKARTFGQDMLDSEGAIALARGQRRSITGPAPKADPRAFGTGATAGRGPMIDQMLGDKKGLIHKSPTTADPDFYRKKTAAETTSPRGSLGHPETTADPAFYIKKRAAEAKVGRELPLDEFLRDHYTLPDTSISTGTSIFDPVLCELVYRWFCPPGGTILDPFAGGSVRGIVAAELGRRYIGVDLRPEQIEANRAQARAIGSDPAPEWIVGDSAAVIPTIESRADFVFSCPPYADLEVYSEDPRDLSTMAYGEFRRVYAEIIAAACERLLPDRFACFVVGDVRDKKGIYYGFPWHTIQAFEDAGVRLYNEAVLVTAAGSLPIRAGKQFSATRKLGKSHQNILVFVKGDPRKATEAIGTVDFSEGTPDAGGDEFEVVGNG